jgi:mRNA interferase MazF
MYKRGDIVLVPFPFTDLSQDKVRPAYIVGVHEVDMVVLFITSVYKSSPLFSAPISMSASNGLKVNSKIIVTKLATLDQKMSLGKLGVLEKEYQVEVDEKLKSFLGL